jgi:hypothetical protein
VRLAVSILTAAVLVVASGCGGDSEDSAGTTSTSTTTSSVTSDSVAPTEEPESLTDEEYSEAAGEFQQELSTAGDDFCEVMAASAVGPTSMPSSPAQVEEAVNGIISFFTALAALDSVDPGDAEVFSSTAQDLSRSAEEAGYSVEFMGSPEAQEILAAPDFIAARDAQFRRAAEECPGFELPPGVTQG